MSVSLYVRHESDDEMLGLIQLNTLQPVRAGPVRVDSWLVSSEEN